MGNLLRPGGFFYLSWTNWLSPWGGHSFSPFHYLGPRKGHLVYDRLRPGKRRDTPFVNLYPTYIGPFLKLLRAQPSRRVVRMAPRYYPEFAFLLHLLVLRECLCWDCVTLLQKRVEFPVWSSRRTGSGSYMSTQVKQACAVGGNVGGNRRHEAREMM